MTLKVKVTWPNAGTTFLREDLADVHLEIEGNAIAPSSASKGVREFDVPSGTTSVTLWAEFFLSFGPVTLDDGTVVPEMEKTVWIAEQEYTVKDGTTLEPAASSASIKVHPLVETTNASGTNGAAQIRLRTEFVSLSHFWKAYASSVDEWKNEHTSGVNLSCLGYTGGKPLIWFASIPSACKSPQSAAVSCLVFYRPANDAVKRVDRQQNQFRLNRFLLKPIAGSSDYWKRDHFGGYFPKGPDKPPELYPYLRCGFEDALSRSGKAVLMVHPWPDGLDFGDAASAKLPHLCGEILRFLWASHSVGKKKENIRLGRLGLSAYSAGGQSMYATLGLIGSQVDEVYSFDANGGDPGKIIQWFNQNPTKRCLRMSGAYQIANHAAIKAAIEKANGATTRVTALPPDGTGYDESMNPLWDHVLSALPQKLRDAVRARDDYRHQFAVFGDYTSPSGPRATTFLERFLTASDF